MYGAGGSVARAGKGDTAGALESAGPTAEGPLQRDLKEMVHEKIKNSKIVICPKEEPLPVTSKGITEVQVGLSHWIGLGLIDRGNMHLCTRVCSVAELPVR